MNHSFYKWLSNRQWPVYLLILSTLLLSACQPEATEQRKGQQTASSGGATQSFDLSRKWSDTSPKVNLHHIFAGEINRRGKPTGYHSRPGGQDPSGARIKSVSKRPNGAGVYTAQVEIKDPDTGKWKQKFSSLFPDTLSHQAVIDAILYAYKNRDKGKDTPWSGPSGLGFQINGYTNRDGSINTAFPIFVGN